MAILTIASFLVSDVTDAFQHTACSPAGVRSRLPCRCTTTTSITTTAAAMVATATRNSIFPRSMIATATKTRQETSKLMSVNTDGVVDVSELMHVPLVTSHFNGVSKTMKTFKFAEVLRQIKGLFNVDKRIMAFIVIFCVSHNFILRSIYRLTHLKASVPYEDTFLGYMESSLTRLAFFFPALYAVDIICIILAGFGYTSHIEGGIPLLFCQVAYQILAASFCDAFKNYFVQQIWRKWKPQAKDEYRDLIREKTIDEMTSLLIWSLFLGLTIETCSLKFGFALGSLLTLGGIGSASLVLAMKGTMEDVLGGIALKVQDKFRIGETISIPSRSENGIIKEISYLDTKILLDDNSIISLPNKVFATGSVLNWSRIPYRNFKTTMPVNLVGLSSLPTILEEIRSQIMALEGVEHKQRNLIVATTGFLKNKMLIEVSVHFKSQGTVKNKEMASKITNIMADTVAKYVPYVPPIQPPSW